MPPENTMVCDGDVAFSKQLPLPDPSIFQTPLVFAVAKRVIFPKGFFL